MTVSKAALDTLIDFYWGPVDEYSDLIDELLDAGLMRREVGLCSVSLTATEDGFKALDPYI